MYFILYLYSSIHTEYGDCLVFRMQATSSASATPPATAAGAADMSSKLDLLRRAYRVLKHNFDESERALAAERAAGSNRERKL